MKKILLKRLQERFVEYEASQSMAFLELSVWKYAIGLEHLAQDRESCICNSHSSIVVSYVASWLGMHNLETLQERNDVIAID